MCGRWQFKNFHFFNEQNNDRFERETKRKKLPTEQPNLENSASNLDASKYAEILGIQIINGSWKTRRVFLLVKSRDYHGTPTPFSAR
jgi:hypothetical protein